MFPAVDLQELGVRGAAPSGPAYGYKMVTDDQADGAKQMIGTNPFNQVQRGGWLDLQDLVKRGASPNGPAYGYKQVSDQSYQSQSNVTPKNYNPFGQQIRGGWLDLQALNKRGASPNGPVFGYR